MESQDLAIQSFVGRESICACQIFERHLKSMDIKHNM